MTKISRSIALLITGAFICVPLFGATCESFAHLSFPHVSITSATSIAPDAFSVDDSHPIPNLPAFCRVQATLTPTPDSNIHIEVWLPTLDWNGKYEGTGTGGYAGKINYNSLAGGLRHGYAVANTDMGTSVPKGSNADLLVDHPERWADWGWRSTHEMTVAAKQFVEAFYDREPERAYFDGCSTGGEQALMEAQRFPDDYEGIVAGAPANNRTHLHMAILWNYAAGSRTPADNIPKAKLPMITEALLNACPKAKAVASDAFLTSPEDCHWDPNALLCKSSDAPDCLTAEQVATARKIFQRPREPPHRRVHLSGRAQGQ